MTISLRDDLWRPDRWFDVPPEASPRWPVLSVVIGLLVVWNVVANVAPPEAGLPVGVFFAVLLVVAARRGGLSWDHMGFNPAMVARGLRVGLVAGAALAALIAAAAVLPATRDFFADDRFVGVRGGQAAYELLLRIPLGTALAEEVAFRGVLLGLLLLWMAPLRAVAASSLLFGLWHVLPALDSIETNPAGDVAAGAWAILGAVFVQVAATGLVGAGLCWLRFKGNHLLGPVLTHWSINGAAYAAGWLIVRNAWA